MLIVTVTRTPTHHENTLAVTRDIWRHGLELDRGVMARLRGHDFVRFRTGTRRFVSISHPALIEHVLFEGRENYVKSIEFETLRAVFGVALITDDGESWTKTRGIIQPMFAKRRLNELVDLMVEPIEKLAATLEAQVAPGDPTRVDMSQAMVDITLDVVGNTLFGRGFSAINERMSQTVTDGMRRAEDLTRVMLLAGPPRFAVRAFVWLVRSRIMVPPGAIADMRRILRTTDAAIDEVIADRLENPTDDPDLLNLLLASTKAKDGMPMARVRGEALQFMLAGHETTANAMNWLWYLLAKNPEARDRMFKEIDTVLGDRTPGLDDLAALPWTTACIEEAMRFYSPVPILPRLAIKDDIIGGHHIRKGTTVIVPAHLVHHDPRVWESPEHFDPSRFLPGADVGRSRSAYLPFGGGRRICIGRSFALMEMVLIAATLGRHLTFDLVPGHPIEPESCLTLRPRYGLPMMASRRGVVAV